MGTEVSEAGVEPGLRVSRAISRESRSRPWGSSAVPAEDARDCGGPRVPDYPVVVGRYCGEVVAVGREGDRVDLTIMLTQRALRLVHDHV